MSEPGTSLSRKKFFKWASMTLASFSLYSIVSKKRKNGDKISLCTQESTVKFLTEDGQLVEVDRASLPSAERKITDEELKRWLTK